MMKKLFTERHGEGKPRIVETLDDAYARRADVAKRARLDQMAAMLGGVGHRGTAFRFDSRGDVLEAIEDDAEIVASSDVMRAFEADLKLFGHIAFQQPLPDDEDDKPS